jgi:prepilin-type processing-associated H-X9-DG protein
MEQGNLQKLGAGLPRDQQLKINGQLVGTVIPMYNCPSRRNGGPFKNSENLAYQNSTPTSPPWLARSDYASNAGFAIDPKTGKPVDDFPWDGNGPGPNTLAEGDKPSFWTQYPYNRRWVGVIYMRSQHRIADITNGTSNTYLLGEKYPNSTDYFTGNDPGDNEHMFVGADNDINRLTRSPPLRDTRGYQNALIFGSAHVGGCNMLYCDGRVEVVGYDIAQAVHQRAGDRR